MPETVETVLYCFNAAEDEVARRYMPLTRREEIASPDGRFYFAAFARPPVRINAVKAGGRSVGYELFTEYLRADSNKISVEYDFAPLRKDIDGASDFGAEVGEYMLAYGAAAEYCLINGEAEAAGLLEGRYRAEIDGAQRRLPSGGRIPPRRWI